jgi:hypothetical protein
MLYAPLDGKERFLTAAAVVHFNDHAEISIHLAVGSYDKAFQPTEGFGANGISLPPPYWPAQARHLSASAMAGIPGTRPASHAVDYRGTQVGVSGNKVKAIFPGGFVGLEHSEPHTWCLQLDAATGEPTDGLGASGNESLLALPTRNGQLLTPQRAVFSNDGSFMLLATAGDKAYLQRFHANATLDESFAGGAGFIELPTRSGKFGLAVRDDLLVVSSAASFFGGQPTTLLYGFTLTGQPVPDFTREISMALPGNLQLDHAQFDNQGRLVLAGQRVFQANHDPVLNSEMRVVRLQPNGDIDQSFGEAGFTPADPLLWAANWLNVDEDGISVLAVLPVIDNRPFYEVVARFQS